MRRFLRHDIHPRDPQPRFLQHAATQLRAGAVVALPTAAGYGLACALDDKSAADRLQRCASLDDRAPATLLCRDVAQAASHAHIDDHAFRMIRAGDDGRQAFVLRATRRVPRRLAAAAQGPTLLCFAGHPVAQGLLAHLDEPLLLALPSPSAASLSDLPAPWQGVVDLALDAGPVPEAQPWLICDPDSLLRSQRLSRWSARMADLDALVVAA